MTQDFTISKVGPGVLQGQRSPSLVIWLLLIGMLVPSELTFNIGDFKFYTERLIVLVLFVPALVTLLGRDRRLMLCDLFMFAASAWMIVAILLAGRSTSLSSIVAVVIEFFGGYIVARAYVYGRAALDTYVSALKVVAVVAIAVAFIDHLTGEWVMNDIVGKLTGVPLGTVPEFRSGLARAKSTFAHPIFYGTFCATAGAIFLYRRNYGYAALTLFGCFLGMSSAPLLVFTIAIAIHCFDLAMRPSPSRWKILTALVAMLLISVFLTTNNPTSWLIAHLTLDPSTGYFREATWQRAFFNIGLSPLTGYGLDEIGGAGPKDFFDNASVDCVWLVSALRFGLPVIPLLLLANITSYYGFGQNASLRADDAYMSNMRTGFTLVVWIFMLAGLTVHYWNTMWLFWGVCIGIRASLQEYSSKARARTLPAPSVDRLRRVKSFGHST